MTFRGRKIDTGVVVSVIAHVAVLLWAAVSFAAKPPDTMPTDSIFVETMSLSDFSQMTKGSKTAPKPVENPKPLVEKVAETKPPPEDVTAQVSDKEIQTASAAPEPTPDVKMPEPKPKPVEAKPEPKPEPKPEAKKEEAKEAKKEPEQKPEAEALKKDDKKQEKPKKEAAKPVPTPPTPPKKPDPPKHHVAEKKPPRNEPKFDADRIAALLDKRQPQRLAAAGDTVNTTAALGTQSGFAMRLSQDEMDALRARLQQCWSPPVGTVDGRDITVLVRIRFNQDGSLSAPPALASRGSGTAFQAAADAALRAVVRCAPYSFMPPAKYEAWKDVEVNFDPREMYRG
jgi:colicin import membrane protein